MNSKSRKIIMVIKKNGNNNVATLTLTTPTTFL